MLTQQSARTSGDPRLRRRASASAVVLRVLGLLSVCGLLAVMTHGFVTADEPKVQRKIQPKVLDFSRMLKQKAEARRMLDLAQQAALNGDIATARRHADRAAAIPVEWNLGEKTPEMFLEDLSDGVFDEPSAPQATEQQRPIRNDVDVIELPAKRPTRSAPKAPPVVDNKPPVLKTNTRSTKSLDEVGFKQASKPVTAPAMVEELPPPPAPTGRRVLATIPSLEELASNEPSTSPAAESDDMDREMSALDDDVADDEQLELEPIAPPVVAPRKHSAAKAKPATDSRNIAKWNDPLKFENDRKPSANSRAFEPAARANAAIPAPVIHEFHIADRTPAPAAESNASSQFVKDLNGLLLAGLFGALIVLVVILSVVTLRWFGSNPALNFKLEMNGPIAVPLAMAAAPAVPTVPAARAADRSNEVAPLYALKRQREEDLEQQQEDAMMKQVFEENLKLRADLEDVEEIRIAA